MELLYKEKDIYCLIESLENDVNKIFFIFLFLLLIKLKIIIKFYIGIYW